MLTNLFSSFDPSTKSLLQMNWISMITALIILPKKFWVKSSRMTLIKKIFKNKMLEEMSNITKNQQIKMIMVSTFMFIIINNIMGLTPYTFTATSHLVVSLSLSLPMWLMLMIYGWTKSTNLMFAHLVPSGTPAILMPFMILIETISNFIRPISLSVRLMANMIAGHLLMTLLGNINSIKIMPLIMIIQMILLTFEMAISMIQAYVFTILGTLYSSEIP
nr:ATP synthase F0 subunit 6 [Cixiidae sp.]